jgi:hypothetical protein
VPSAFLDRTPHPRDRDLDEVLGRTGALWTQLRNDLASRFAPLDESWTWSGQSHGWILKLTRKRRTVLYMVPGRGSFVASFALREPDWKVAQGSDLSAAVLEIIANAPPYAEGRGVRLEVRSRKDLGQVLTLAEIKMTGEAPGSSGGRKP